MKTKFSLFFSCLFLSQLLGFSVLCAAEEFKSNGVVEEDAIPQDKRTDAKWKVGLLGRSTDDTLSTSKVVGLYGIVKVDHKISDDLFATLKAGAILETGSSSALFTDEFQPQSFLFLQEATVTWHVWQPLSLKVGALDQEHLESPLLVDYNSTFPAAEEIVEQKISNWTLHLDSQQAIPTSERLSAKSDGKENTPSLLTETAFVKYEEPKSLLLKLRATHFQFNSLTHGMAQDSRFYGNTITGIATGSSFYYNYQGFEAGGDAGFALDNRLYLNLKSSFLQNTQVPTVQAQGQYYQAEVKYEDEKMVLAPRYEFYRNAADSAPAFYTSKEFGHNNRQGSGVAVKASLKQIGVDFEARWFQSHLLQSNTFQQDRFQFIQLIMEIPYASF